MTFQYYKCVRGQSFHPDIEIPVRGSYWRGLRASGLTWVGITASEQAWHLGRYGFESNIFPEPTPPAWPGVTSWIEAANAAGLRTVTRGDYSAQMGQTGLNDPSYLEEPILKHAERVAVTSPQMNAFQPVAEWAVPNTPENCEKIHAFYEKMVPKIRAVMPSHTLVFSGPQWCHLPLGDWGMPPMVDKNGVWAFDLYRDDINGVDHPSRIASVYAQLKARAEMMIILEAGAADRSMAQTAVEAQYVQEYQNAAFALKIPVAGFITGEA